MKVIFHQIGDVDDALLTHAVIAARYSDHWIFVRHRSRQTWELPEGCRQAEESIEQTARRMLWEQTGATQLTLHPVCVYSMQCGDNERCGMLYYAVITDKGEIPACSEIAETCLRHPLPRTLTYPETHSALYHKVQDWLNRRTSSDELWDVYDADRNVTGRLHRRGAPLIPGEYHLSVAVWIIGSNGKILLTRRSTNKGYPMIWEITGGSAQAGDDSLTAALREAREETGLRLNPDSGRLMLALRGKDCFNDVWFFHQDVDLSQIVLQEGETCDAQLVTRQELLDLRKEDMFIPCAYLEELFSRLDNG